jgi:formate hydrogenlyase subunit 3/multisubunit Na+/H+ antiporter MnhD subunit
MTPALATGSGGALLVVAVFLPVVGMLGIFLLGVRRAWWIAPLILPAGLMTSLAIAFDVAQSGMAVTYALGNWQPPLGIALRADGLAAVFMVMTAWILCAVALYAGGASAGASGTLEDRRPNVFWILLLGLWCALNTTFLAQDLFTLFVALELLTFSAVPLVCLDGKRETLQAALRYLLFALVGSVFYLIGAAVLYGNYGTLDLSGLREAARYDLATAIAVGLMIVGLMAKAALFPLHLWLPPAHAGAPPAASAVLSALVVKAPFFLILRLWFDVAPQSSFELPAHILAGLGMASIIVCSVMALRQERLKLMIAYSTVAQIGYLFLMFPLVTSIDGSAIFQSIGWTGGVLQAVSHALAKASMFLAAGVIAETFGHDRIDKLNGAVTVVPVSIAAFGLSGLSLMGLPPSGGFVAKLMLLTAATENASWWVAATILLGGILAASYVFRVLGRALAAPPEGLSSARRVPLRRELVVLGLAICAVLLGFVPLQPFGFLGIGRTGLP